MTFPGPHGRTEAASRVKQRSFSAGHRPLGEDVSDGQWHIVPCPGIPVRFILPYHSHPSCPLHPHSLYWRSSLLSQADSRTLQGSSLLLAISSLVYPFPNQPCFCSKVWTRSQHSPAQTSSQNHPCPKAS